MTLRPKFRHWAKNESIRTMTISFGYAGRTRGYIYISIYLYIYCRMKSRNGNMKRPKGRLMNKRYN